MTARRPHSRRRALRRPPPCPAALRRALRRGLRRGGPLRTGILRLLPAALLGAGVAVLVSCGSSGAGLIPAENAGPLLGDFRAVEAAAKAGHGDCAPTETALRTTESDFQRLPGSVDAGLHGRLQEGISKLSALALEMCAEPLGQTATGASTPTAKTTAPPTTTTTQTQTTSTATTQSTPTGGTTGTGVTPTTSQPSGSQGGTPVEEGGSGEAKSGEGAANGKEGSGGSGEGAKSGEAGASGGTGGGGGQ